MRTTRAFSRTADHRAGRPTILAAAALAAVVLLALIYLAAIAPRGVPLVKYYYVNAEFRNTENLKLLSTVQIAGRRVGQVSKVTYKGGLAVVKLQILPGNQKLTSDARVRIRVKNPIGAKYVEITPSTKGTTLKDGGTLPPSQTSTAVDVQTLLDAFPAPTRGNVSRSLVGLGKGFLGRGAGIHQALPKATPLLSNLQALSSAVLARPGAASDFAPSADSLAAAFDPVRVQLGEGFKPQAEVLQDFADERGVIQQTLDVAPSSLGALRQGLAQSQPLLEQTEGLAKATVKLTGPAPAALRATTKLLVRGVPSLQRTLPLLTAIHTAVHPTVSVLNRVDPVIDPTIKVLNNQMKPLTNFVAHGCDFLTQASNWRSALSEGVPGNYDPASHLTAMEPGLGPNVNSFRVLLLPETTTETLDADAPGNFPHGVDAYPAPCTATTEKLP